MKPGRLDIYVDESGSPDVTNRFGKDLLTSGETSNHLVLAALRTADTPALEACVRACVAWADARYGSGAGYPPVTSLHARDDRPALKGLVCGELAKLPIKCTAIVMDKRLLDPSRPWRSDPTRFYNEMAAYLLSDSLHLYAQTRIIFSRKNYDTTADLRAMTQAVASRWGVILRRIARPPTSASAVHVKAAGNPGLQAVDYVAWAVFRAFERGDFSYVTALQPILGHVWDLARFGHYTRKSPMKNPP